MSTLEPLDLRHLDPRLSAMLVAPGDPRWDEARRAWNLAVDQVPAAVAMPSSAADVVALVALAREHGLRVAPQGTGHNAAAIASLEGTILMTTSGMREVRVDPLARSARLEAGALWMDVTVPAGEHGLAALAGSSPDVGVVGYCLGGGVSWLARQHGLACNSVLAVELVTADGRLVRATPEDEPDLFWALRGGGGSFGVVTALELRLFPAAEVFAGALFFPWERSSEVLHAWREWAATVPESVTSVGRIMQMPPIPDVPEFLRGRQFAIVEATMLGTDADEGARLLEPLRALAPEIDTFAMIPAPELSRLHMDPEEPVPYIGSHRLLADLPPEAVDVLVALAGPGSGSSLLSVEVRHLGGALAREPRGAGALAALAGGFMTFGVGLVTGPDAAAAITADLERLMAALEPFDAGRSYLNFTEEPADPARFYDEATLARLRAVKAAYDPDDRFRANHPIPPSPAPAV